MKGGSGASEGDVPAGGADEFKELADGAPVMIWRTGADKLCDFVNRPWLDFTGRSFEEELGLRWAEGVHPEDHERCLRIRGEAFDAREPFEMDFRLRRHDGVYRWVLDHGRPFERGGAFAGYFGSCLDIEDRKRLEIAQLHAVDEINHRVKNILASVQALAQQSFRGTGEPHSAYTAFCGRLQAMAAAHDMVACEREGCAELGQLVARVARPHIEEGLPFEAAGMPVRVNAKRAVALAVSLNELFTNASRHGALAAETGRVTLEWSVDPRDRVRLVWREQGGPQPAAPAGQGTGCRLIEALGREGGGATRFELAPDGIVCTIDFPLARAAEETA